MSFSKLSSAARRLLLLAMVAVLILGMLVPVHAEEEKDPYQSITTTDKDAEFTYELFLTDANGNAIENPRRMSAGDTIYVEIRLTRNKYTAPNYESYGIEFRLLTRGLTYNYDGTTLRSGTDVREMKYFDGDSVGFAWYDLQKIGESINNPVLVASWSYTVENPSKVNLTVPVALIYITEDNEEHYPVGPATLYLEYDAGKMLGEDVSGTYTSGAAVTLPDMEHSSWTFLGWSDGVRTYPAGSEYVVSGIVTLTAVWEKPEQNRHLSLQTKGGTLEGEDVSGNYADGEVVILPDATREGYDFLGWSDGENLFPAGSEYTVNGNVNLTAQWKRKDQDCKLTLDSNGGGSIANDVSGYYTQGEVLTLPEAPAREGYEFLGWSDGENLYPAGTQFTVTGNVKLTAQWKLIPVEDPTQPTEPSVPGPADDWILPGWVGPVIFWSVILVLLAVALWFLRWIWGWLWGWLLLLIPLWKRDYVLYSLTTGNLIVD